MKEHPATRVVIGMDPHKRSVTIEVMRPDESVATGGPFDTDPAGYAAMLEVARAWPERVWAVEGCNGGWASAAAICGPRRVGAPRHTRICASSPAGGQR